MHSVKMKKKPTNTLVIGAPPARLPIEIIIRLAARTRRHNNGKKYCRRKLDKLDS